MNPKITPEILSALEQHPTGPIRLEGESGTPPVYLVRLDDIANLQELVDGRIRESLAEADADIAAGRTGEWNPKEIKRRGHERFGQNEQS
jgi:hypothetical protein